jgi:hypothetical protein
MDGLLLSGGADIHPSRYGQAVAGSKEIEDDRDELESIAWRIAETRSVPVLGLCRGLQAINVFSGGTLLQHVEGHHGAGWGLGPPVTHPIRLVRGTRLASLLGPAEELEVNAYHHQGHPCGRPRAEPARGCVGGQLGGTRWSRASKVKANVSSSGSSAILSAPNRRQQSSNGSLGRSSTPPRNRHPARSLRLHGPAAAPTTWVRTFAGGLVIEVALRDSHPTANASTRVGRPTLATTR